MSKHFTIGLFTVLISLLVLAGCAGPESAPPQPPESGLAAVAETALGDGVAAALPPIPLDIGAVKTHSATDEPGDPANPPPPGGQEQSVTVLGKDFIQQLNGVIDGDALVLDAPGASGDDASAASEPAYGLYRAGGLDHRRALSLNVECVPQMLDQGYFVGIADYTNFKWRWFGPVHLPEFQLDLRGHNQQFITQLGNLYFIVACHAGNAATHHKTTVVTGPPDGGCLPGGPHHLMATDGKFAGKIGLEWQAGMDAQRYEVFRKPARQDSVWHKVGDATDTSFLDLAVPDGVLFYYVVRSVNANGQSSRSNVDSGFAGGGGPRVINGDVTLPNGAPVPGVRVILVGHGEEALRMTNAEGRFQFGDLPPGRYILAALKPELDFVPRSAVADLRQNNLAQVHFNALPEAPFHRIWGFAYEYAGDAADAQPPQFQPLAGLPVQAHPVGQPDQTVTVLTDDNGLYHFEDLPVGVYLIRAVREGYGFLPAFHEVVVNGDNRPDRRDFIGFAGGVPPPPPGGGEQP